MPRKPKLTEKMIETAEKLIAAGNYQRHVAQYKRVKERSKIACIASYTRLLKRQRQRLSLGMLPSFKRQHRILGKQQHGGLRGNARKNGEGKNESI